MSLSRRHEAVAEGRTQEVKYLFDAAVPVDARNETTMRTPLHEAAISGHVEITRLLLEHGACPNAQDSEGRTPLWYSFQKLQVSKELGERGGDVLRSNEHRNWMIRQTIRISDCDETRFSVSLLHLAVQRGLHDMAEMILASGVRPNVMTNDFVDSMQMAIMENDTRMVEILAKYGAKVQLTTFGYGLHYAVKHRYTKIAELLLKKEIAEVDFFNMNGMTALHQAVKCGYHDLVDICLKYKANPNSRCLLRGHLVLYYAIKQRNLTMVRLLLDRGAKAHEFYCERRTDDITLLDKAVKMGDERIVMLLLERGAIILHPKKYVGDKHKIAMIARCVAQLAVRKPKSATIKFNIQTVRSHHTWLRIYWYYEKEVARTQKFKLFGDCSLIDIIAKDENELATLAQNENFERAFHSSLSILCSEYRGFALKKQVAQNFELACVRRNLMKKAHDLFTMAKPVPLPFECTEKVLRECSNYELVVFIMSNCSYKMDHLGLPKNPSLPIES